MKGKPNLVLTHSFPTNSILLTGLIEYLEDFFEVHFIDLPGFVKHEPPLENIDLDGYRIFVEKKLKELDLPEYIAAGISFGFRVMNEVQYDNRCKGIVAMVPFIGASSLYMGLGKKLAYSSFIKSVCSSGQYNRIWQSDLLRTYLPRFRNYPPGTIDVMLEHVDGKTFFETAKFLLDDTGGVKFQDLPYALLISNIDKTVNSEYLRTEFSEGTEHLLIIDFELDHYPPEMTKDYFRSKMSEETVKRLIRFFDIDPGT